MDEYAQADNDTQARMDAHNSPQTERTFSGGFVQKKASIFFSLKSSI